MFDLHDEMRSTTGSGDKALLVRRSFSPGSAQVRFVSAIANSINSLTFLNLRTNDDKFEKPFSLVIICKSNLPQFNSLVSQDCMTRQKS